MKKHVTLFFSLIIIIGMTGCSGTTKFTGSLTDFLKTPETQKNIRNQMTKVEFNEENKSHTFCNYEIMDFDKEDTENNTINAFLWVDCHNYTFNDKKIETGKSGAGTTPIIVTINTKDENYKIIKFNIPGAFNQNIEKIFSEENKKYITGGDLSQETKANLSKKNLAEAQKYFQ